MALPMLSSGNSRVSIKKAEYEDKAKGTKQMQTALIQMIHANIVPL